MYKSQQERKELKQAIQDQLAPLIKRIEALEQAAQPQTPPDVLEQIEEKAREWAGHYAPLSDGWNTFIMFADWVATLPRPHRDGAA